MLSQLLPYDPYSRVKKTFNQSLNEYNFLLTAEECVQKSLKEGNLEAFDALVGENACQIRAFKIAFIFSHSIKQADELINKVVKAKEKLKHLSENASLGVLLKKENLDIPLDKDELFLIESYILTIAKTKAQIDPSHPYMLREASYPKKLLGIEKNVTTTFANHLVKALKKDLSRRSVEYVQELARELNETKLQKILACPILCRQLLCLPMFWNCKPLVLKAQKVAFPILFTGIFVDKSSHKPYLEETFLLDAKTNKEIDILSLEDLNHAAVCIEGVVETERPLKSLDEWKKKICTRGLEIILASAAMHRQYLDEDEREVMQDEEHDHYKKMALKEGYCLDNPSTFSVQHVFARSLGSVPRLKRRAKLVEKIQAEMKHPVDAWPKKALSNVLSFLDKV